MCVCVCVCVDAGKGCDLARFCRELSTKILASNLFYYSKSKTTRALKLFMGHCDHTLTVSRLDTRSLLGEFQKTNVVVESIYFGTSVCGRHMMCWDTLCPATVVFDINEPVTRS